MNPPFPTIDEGFLKALTAMFPERCADPSWTDREVWMRAGEQRVIRFLTTKYKEQENPASVYQRPQQAPQT